jgi:hypothetical protein
MTVYILSILLFILCCVSLGLWVWAGGVYSDYLEAKWGADYYENLWREAVLLIPQQEGSL